MHLGRGLRNGQMVLIDVADRNDLGFGTPKYLNEVPTCAVVSAADVAVGDAIARRDRGVTTQGRGGNHVRHGNAPAVTATFLKRVRREICLP